MTSKIIEDKKAKLSAEEKNIQEELKKDYEDLGRLVSSGLEAPSDESFEMDLSILLKDEERRKRFNKLLIGIGKLSIRLEEIKKETEELDLLKTCPKCGNVVDDGELFCACCGERLIRETAGSDEGVCPQCMKPKKSGGAFCVYCGYKFEVSNKVTAKPAGRVCKNCGTELPANVLFCHVCGSKQE